MRYHWLLLALSICYGTAQTSTPKPPKTLVAKVHDAALAGDFASARLELGRYRATLGVTPEYIEALSWIGRGELSLRQTAAAEANAAEVRGLCETELKHRRLDAEAHLPIALGAAIEVEAQSLGLENRRDEAVLFLRDELKHWQGTSIAMRIQKNVNLLTLEGKPVPPLEVSGGIGVVKPQPLEAHRGHPVLLFLWAHWCVDCKAEVAIVQRLEAAYGRRGLVVVAPTQHYGYIAGGEEASRDVETKYITEVFDKYYASLGKVEVPVSEENFRRFGVSTTPTLLLLDKQGIVRLYNPGALTYEALAAKIEPLLAGK
jgi:thiol-disulfide isomerase/thioredoxin